MWLAIALIASILAGAVIAFFKEFPLVRDFFMRDFREGHMWPWWYGQGPLFYASKRMGILVPFHIPVNLVWRLWSRIRFGWDVVDRQVYTELIHDLNMRIERYQEVNRILTQELGPVRHGAVAGKIAEVYERSNG